MCLFWIPSIQEGLPADFKSPTVVPDYSSPSRWCLTHADPQRAERKCIYTSHSKAVFGLEFELLKGQKLKDESKMKRGDDSCFTSDIFFNLLCQVPNKSWGCTKEPVCGSFLDIFHNSLWVFCLANKASTDPSVCMTFWSKHWKITVQRHTFFTNSYLYKKL